jgi:hypothetical protein
VKISEKISDFHEGRLGIAFIEYKTKYNSRAYSIGYVTLSLIMMEFGV